jgi:hypothetical protein
MATTTDTPQTPWPGSGRSGAESPMPRRNSTPRAKPARPRSGDYARPRPHTVDEIAAAAGLSRARVNALVEGIRKGER